MCILIDKQATCLIEPHILTRLWDCSHARGGRLFGNSCERVDSLHGQRTQYEWRHGASPVDENAFADLGKRHETKSCWNLTEAFMGIFWPWNSRSSPLNNPLVAGFRVLGLGFLAIINQQATHANSQTIKARAEGNFIILGNVPAQPAHIGPSSTWTCFTSLRIPKSQFVASDIQPTQIRIFSVR